MSRSYPPRPLVGVGVVVLRGDEVLLVRRGKAPRRGDWSLPGGAQELGETVFEAAVREAREETGLDVAVVGLVDVVDSITRDAAGAVRYHYTLVDVLAEWRGGEARAAGDAADVAWAPLDRLADYGLWSETVRVIRLAADRRAASVAGFPAPAGP